MDLCLPALILFSYSPSFLPFFHCSGSGQEKLKNLVKHPLDEKTVSQPLLNITVSGRGVGRRWEIAKESTMYIYDLGLLTIARSLIESTVSA